MEEVVCFKCHETFVSYRALEVHLMSCDAEFEPHRAAPWAFIPPPDILNGGRGPRFRHPSSQNRSQQAPRAPPRVRRQAKSANFDSATPSPVAQRNRGRRQSVPASSPTNNATARCTKCDLTFPDAETLSQHLIESPAHPYSTEAPKNSWTPPGFEAEGEPEDSRRRFSPDKTGLSRGSPRDGGTARAADSAPGVGKRFRTDLPMTRHWSDLVRQENGADSSVAVGGENQGGGVDDSVTSASSTGAGDDEVDELAAAIARLLG